MIPTAGKKVRWKKKKAASQDLALNITSMADIFTIILVFLLKSLSSDAATTPPSAMLTLPTAQIGDRTAETLNVEVSTDEVRVGGSRVAALKAARFSSTDIPANGMHPGIDRAIGAAKALHPDSRLSILADRKTPYHTLKTILASAANHGYTDYKLVVVREED